MRDLTSRVSQGVARNSPEEEVLDVASLGGRGARLEGGWDGVSADLPAQSDHPVTHPQP